MSDFEHAISCKHFERKSFSSYICLPLNTQKGQLGILVLTAPPLGVITDHQQQVSITFCEVLKLCLSNISLRKSLQEQSTIDTLSGLYNRRYLEKLLPQQLNRAFRNNKTLSIAMFDLDNFKEINDKYGHQAGDEVLKFIGKLLKKEFRGYDSAFRYGGEEFLLVIEDNLSVALPRFKSICHDVKASRVQFESSSLPTITLSMGVVESKIDDSDPDALIKLADEALYKAKGAGKDRIEIV